jgi:hypothetical protein
MSRFQISSQSIRNRTGTRRCVVLCWATMGLGCLLHRVRPHQWYVPAWPIRMLTSSLKSPHKEPQSSNARSRETMGSLAFPAGVAMATEGQRVLRVASLKVAWWVAGDRITCVEVGAARLRHGVTGHSHPSADPRIAASHPAPTQLKLRTRPFQRAESDFLPVTAQGVF